MVYLAIFTWFRGRGFTSRFKDSKNCCILPSIGTKLEFYKKHQNQPIQTICSSILPFLSMSVRSKKIVVFQMYGNGQMTNENWRVPIWKVSCSNFWRFLAFKNAKAHIIIAEYSKEYSLSETHSKVSQVGFMPVGQLFAQDRSLIEIWRNIWSVWPHF